MKIQLKNRLLCGLLTAVLILLPLPDCGEKQQDDSSRVRLTTEVSASAAGAASNKISAPAEGAAPAKESVSDKKSASASDIITSPASSTVEVSASAAGAVPDKDTVSAEGAAPFKASACDKISAPVNAEQNDASSQPSVAVSAPPHTQQVTVYVTNTGSKYHPSGCQYLAKSCISIDLTSA